MMILETKFLMPIITFLLGLLAIPYMENRKEKLKSTSILNCFKVEISDEEEYLKHRIIKMTESYKTLSAIKNGDTSIIGNTSKYVPKKTTSYYLSSLLLNSFLLLSKHQRFSIKSMEIQIDAINKYSQDINESRVEKNNIKDLINSCKRYIYTALSLRACFSSFLNDIDLTDKTDKDIVESQIIEIGLDLTISDLEIKHEVTFNN